MSNSTWGEEMQKRRDRPKDPSSSMGDYPTSGLILQKTIRKRNIFNSPASVCEMVHKINCPHKPPRLVGFSLQQEEGKNEKTLYIHNSFVSPDSLYITSGPDIRPCCNGNNSAKYAESCLDLLRAERQHGGNSNGCRWQPIRSLCISGRQYL
jgi:hypothetical protein